MLKFKTVTATDLEKIYLLKEQGNQHKKFKSENVLGGAKTNLVMPHDSFIVGLSSLKSQEQPKPEIAGLQVIDATAGGFKSIFNLYSDNQLQMLTGKSYLKSYENAFDKVLNLDVDKKDFEVRSIKIPALHVEAIWLHNEDDENNDLFTPLRSIGLFEDNKTYSKNEFFNISKDAAVNFDTDDNLIGG